MREAVEDVLMDADELERLRELEQTVRGFLKLAQGADAEPVRTVERVKAAIGEMRRALVGVEAARRDARVGAIREGAWS